MKNFTLFLLTAIGILTVVTSANAQADRNVCGSNEAWQDAINIDPSLVLRRQQMESQIEKYVNNRAFNRVEDDGAVRIIPVVFHVIHEGGTENISEAQIRETVDILNQDYRRKNADTVNTPLAFRPVAADAGVEFRIATKDPYGNCTNGINRVFSHRTNNFSDFGKSLIDWPSDRYLNIWVVKTIGVKSKYGDVIGYAQFPAGGESATDGVVLQHNFVGKNLGTASSFYAGRDATHEVGHYLSLIHTWGDADCGDDKCLDTPTQFDANFGCKTYPYITCGNNGDMTDNYMDYSDGRCKDIFTKNQKTRMRATLDVARYTLWQPYNLYATGTDDASFTAANACAPSADFLVSRTVSLSNATNHLSVCSGSVVYYKDISTKGTPTSWNWTFPGGNPSSSTVQNPAVTYTDALGYNAKLTASNSNGSSTKEIGSVVSVDFNVGYFRPPYSQSFEGQFPPPEWHVYNDDGGPAWQRSSRSAYAGSYSASIQDFQTFNGSAPGSVKELVTPAFDFTRVTSPMLTFRVSYGKQYSGNTDSLSVGASTTCGAIWVELSRLNSSSLATLSAGLQPNDFAPAPSQWALVSIPLNSYAGNKKVKFHFYFKSDVLSNNLYIDDFNISGVVGINEQENSEFSFDTYPNPASESFVLSYVLKHQEEVMINLYDLQGRLVRQLENKHQAPGEYATRVDASEFNLSSGVYIVKMVTPDGVISKKLIYSAY